jgi:hypothetical protein
MLTDVLEEFAASVIRSMHGECGLQKHSEHGYGLFVKRLVVTNMATIPNFEVVSDTFKIEFINE